MIFTFHLNWFVSGFWHFLKLGEKFFFVVFFLNLISPLNQSHHKSQYSKEYSLNISMYSPLTLKSVKKSFWRKIVRGKYHQSNHLWRRIWWWWWFSNVEERLRCSILFCYLTRGKTYCASVVTGYNKKI